ncbi:hypothetical protein [Rudaeicoccus suwonensis]|uniref:Uncharacterized protein n=1 Tax=Rudaeicoccus suwonensis TaxID=657409 RepID=A0A561EB13_9MICO|nr:hypothetical protein [Rudaeicoccus suwonensis]TWE12798.1 hypothetical protein BKA23_1616 [Rudaeicoccus suwonensis]
MNPRIPVGSTDRPLTAERLASAVDRLTTFPDRQRGCVLLLLLGHDRILRAPVLIEDVDETTDPLTVTETFERLARVVRDCDGSVVFVRGRSGTSAVTAQDQSWGQCMRHTFGELLYACFIATLESVVELPARSAAAS